MEDDQQFCLRWNNHQSTLISVFDTLLEKGVHVDCTLAAEGRTLNAHKVVLSACSPYFEAVLGQQYDKHPIIILKDVKFAELRAMMDYMYRGEVNISQDQLGALLKAAESLQIKGLSDNKPPPPPPPLARPEPQEPAPLEPARPDEERPPSPRPEGRGSREGSESPARRKRKRRRPSLSPTDSRPRYPTPPAAAADCFDAPEPEPDPELPPSPGPIEPKAEYVEGNEDSVEDLTVDEEMDSDGEQPGASRPSDGSDRGYAWQTDNRSRDDTGVPRDGPRDSQDVKKDEIVKKIAGGKRGEESAPPNFKLTLPCAQFVTKSGYTCPTCQRTYNARKNLVRHVNLECGREPQYGCPHCPHRNHRRNELKRHIDKKHGDLVREAAPGRSSRSRSSE